MTRKALALMALLVAISSWSMAAERMALGLIVKMKDGAAPVSVVRLQAAAMPREQPQRVRLRLANAARKANISYIVERPTAFAANVIHNGRPIRLREAQAQAARLRQDPDVEWVVVNELEQPHAVVSTPPNDPLYAQQGWLASGATGGLPNVPAAWNFLNSQTLQPIVVAVLDTGVLRHPDLSNRVLYQDGYDFVSEVDYANDGNGVDDDATDPGDYLTQPQIDQNPALYADCGGVHDSSWHGTEIAGILAAETNNNLGIAGLLASLPGSPVLPVRVGGACGAALIDIIEGMLWAAGVNYNGRPKVNSHPARVINLSFGGSSDCTCTGSQSGNCLYRDAIATLKQKGAILVASAGNAARSDLDGSTATSRPASCPGVLAVTALNVNGQKARYANFVPATTGIATLGGDPSPAPGINSGDNSIYTTTNAGTQGPSMSGGVPTADYRSVPGTSFSAPIVAGTVALMWAVNPGLSVDALIAGLRGHGVRSHVVVGNAPTCSTSPVSSGSCSCTTATCGAGVLDTALAVQWAASQPITAYVEPVVTADYFNPGVLRGGRPSTQSNGDTGGGGGGALDARSLSACVLLALGLALSRRHARARRQPN